VLGRFTHANDLHYYLELAPGRSMVIPAWMTEEGECSQMTWGLDPICSLKSLLKVHSLLLSKD